MITRYIAIFALLCSSWAQAEVPLDRESLGQYFTALAGLQVDLQDYQAQLDALEQSQDDQIMFDAQTWASTLSGLPFAGEIQKSLKSNGFDSIESFTAYGARIFRAMLAVGAEQMPDEMQAIQTLGAAEIAEMRAQGLDEATLAEMQASLATSREMMTAMKSASESVPAADKAAVRDNYDWIQQQFEALEGSPDAEAWDSPDN